MKMFLRLQAGFTMIELILVIAIIGILAATVLGAINPAVQIRKAADAQRKENVKQLQTAIEQYFGNSNVYTCTAATLKPYLPDGIPKDPSTKQPIGCQIPNPATAVAGSYCISATLDNPTGNCNADCTSGTDTNTYCLTNLQ